MVVGQWMKQGGAGNLVEGGSCVVLVGSWDMKSRGKNMSYWMKCLQLGYRRSLLQLTLLIPLLVPWRERVQPLPS